MLACQLRRVEHLVTFTPGAMTSATHRVQALSSHSVWRGACQYFGKSRVAVQPVIEYGLFIDHDCTAHREMSDAAELFAQNVEAAGARRRQPYIRRHAGNQIHFNAELRHGEIVQHVLGTQYEFVGRIEG